MRKIIGQTINGEFIPASLGMSTENLQQRYGLPSFNSRGEAIRYQIELNTNDFSGKPYLQIYEVIKA